MTRISPTDLSFLLLERANRPNHMAALTIFQKPKGQQSSFGPRPFDAYRHSQAVRPFNYKLKWLGKDVAAWETVEPDMSYHVRHIALPKPGDWRQFCIQTSRIHARPLDLNRPLWELYVIEGLDSLLDAFHEGRLSEIVGPRSSGGGSLLLALQARGAITIVIAEEADDTVRPYADHLIEIPAVSTLFQPLLSTIPLQVFAAGVAQARGYDVDKPRNLAKSVTVE